MTELELLQQIFPIQLKIHRIKRKLKNGIGNLIKKQPLSRFRVQHNLIINQGELIAT